MDVDKGCLVVETMGESKSKQRAEPALVHTNTFAKAVIRDIMKMNGSSSLIDYTI